MSRYPKMESHYLLASAAIAVATALSMSSAAFAQDAPAATAPAPQHNATRAEPQTGTLIVKSLDTIKVFGGADLRPGDSQWADNDASAQELPMVRDQDAVKR